MVVVDTQGLARMFDDDGELVARAPIRYTFGGRRLWSGAIAGGQLTEDGGVWLLDPDGRTRARAPRLDTFLCDAAGIGLAVAERRLVLVSTDDLGVIAPVRTAEFLPVCAVQLRDGFAVGTFGERVVAIDTTGNERFAHRLGRREIARALLQPPGSAGLVMIVRDTSSSRMRLATLDVDGHELHSVDIPFVIDAAPYGDGSRFAVIHMDRSKVHTLDPIDGSGRPLDSGP